MKNISVRHIIDHVTLVLLTGYLLGVVACGGENATGPMTDFSSTGWSIVSSSTIAEGQTNLVVNHEGEISFSTDYHASGMGNSSWESTLSPKDLQRLNDTMSEARLLSQEDVVEWVSGCVDGGMTIYEIQTTDFGDHKFRIGGCMVTINSQALKAFVDLLHGLNDSYALHI